MEFEVIFRPENLQQFWEGTVNAMALLVSSLIVGGLLSLPLAVARVSSNRWISGPVWLFTYVLRGTPLLIQVYLIYFGLGQMEYIQARWDDTWPWTWFKEPFFCAMLAFALNTCAYTVELLAGAIRDTFSRTALLGRSTRLVLDMEQDAWWIEETDGVARVRFPGVRGAVTVLGVVDDGTPPYCRVDVSEAMGATVQCDRAHALQEPR
jgi:His/Glu/Gln/Arg/opine family amino acid ABC transporter permease subunit